MKDDILNNVNAKQCAPELRRQKVIAQGIATDIGRARDAKMASGILYDHLYEDGTLQQIKMLSTVLMDVDAGFGKTREVGLRLHARIQGLDSSETEQQKHPHGSQQLPSLSDRENEANKGDCEFLRCASSIIGCLVQYSGVSNACTLRQVLLFFEYVPVTVLQYKYFPMHVL